MTVQLVAMGFQSLRSWTGLLDLASPERLHPSPDALQSALGPAGSPEGSSAALGDTWLWFEDYFKPAVVWFGTWLLSDVGPNSAYWLALARLPGNIT